MIIVIDGYNLLKQIFTKTTGLLDKQRNQLIKNLSYYKQKKKDDLKDIILVFDAGPFGHALREIKDGIVIIFSGQKSSADDWIISYVNKHPSEQIVLVTLDRKLKEACASPHVQTLDVFKFYAILQENIYEEIQANFTTETSTKKYSCKDQHDTYVEGLDEHLLSTSKALDLLMEEATLSVPQKEGPSNKKQVKNKKGNPRKLSKKERGFIRTLKKIS